MESESEKKGDPTTQPQQGESDPATQVITAQPVLQPEAPPTAGQPGAPGYPPTAVQPGAPGYPPTAVQPGAPGYPPTAAQPGFSNPQGGAPGYPPGTVAPGYPPGTVAPGYPLGGGLAGQLAQNLPQAQVTWMPAPTDAPAGCPPGLEYLTQIDQVLVHQQIEILELVTGIETENKYKVCNTLGQQIYFAAEKSSLFQRQCCGAGREFSMAITDNTQREVIHLERPFRCTFPFLQLCQPHSIEVQSPPGTVVGYVKQVPCSFLPKFTIQNAEGDTVLHIKGPCCNCYTDVNFEVTSADEQTNVGRISKQWSGLAKEYFTDADNFGIQFPLDLDVKMKAVMLGACFLIDFMFFERGGGNNQNRGRHRHHY